MLKTQYRDCAGCARCCEGWLWGQAYGTQFRLGQPCFFLRAQKCSIYPVRPHNPCQTFLCEWKRDAGIPEHLWPQTSGIILISRLLRKHNLPYISVVQAGGQITEEILAWAQQHGTQRQPVVIAATQQVFGSPEFQAAYQAESAA